METRRQKFLLLEWWFLWPLGVRLLVWLFLAHVYDIAVFQDVSWQMAMGHGIYAKFSGWLAAYGDGYYAYPPFYAYMLWISGLLSGALGGYWWTHQVLIKAWTLIADLAVFALLYRVRPALARTYWVLWFVPVVAIGQAQPDLWVGLSVLLGLHLARRGHWTATGLVLAAGIGTKFTPLIILPFLVQHLIQARKLRAVLQLVVSTAIGLIIVWLPYVVAFQDEASFDQALMFHASRPAAGLTVLSGLRLLLDAGLAGAGLVGSPAHPGELLSHLLQRVSTVYPLLTLGAFAALAATARNRQWSLERVFCVPLLLFLLTNKVVHEQYLLHLLPALLVAFPDAIASLAAPYSVYVITAGTPLRFFPQEYGFPLTPDALLPPTLQASLGPLVTLGLVVAAGSAVLVFSWQLYRLLRGLLKAQPADRRSGRLIPALATD